MYFNLGLWPGQEVFLGLRVKLVAECEMVWEEFKVFNINIMEISYVKNVSYVLLCYICHCSFNSIFSVLLNKKALKIIFTGLNKVYGPDGSRISAIII